MKLDAPFPWFGGKRRAARLVWERFGRLQHYIEPFAGSLATLLASPFPAKAETVNDADYFISNFWRAVQDDPGAVIKWADWPVNEADLAARHKWLREQTEFQDRIIADPLFYDVQIAGWWVWGIAQWIGWDWCHSTGSVRQLPHLGDTGRGIHAVGMNFGRYCYLLSTRLRSVRVCCGDWKRVLGPSTVKHLGMTGIFLDPPYAVDCDAKYAVDSSCLSAEVRLWAIEHGNNPKVRIALCGYEGEHDMPSEWTKIAWKAVGGYGLQGNGKGRINASRERIWFSPYCLKPTLFENLSCEEKKGGQAAFSYA